MEGYTCRPMDWTISCNVLTGAHGTTTMNYLPSSTTLSTWVGLGLLHSLSVIVTDCAVVCLTVSLILLNSAQNWTNSKLHKTLPKMRELSDFTCSW